MAKQGQHNNDRNDENVSRGHNNPAKSVTVTAGTPKKKETYARQAREHRATDTQPQAAANARREQTHVENRSPDSTYVDPPNDRRGSDSGVSRGSRG